MITSQIVLLCVSDLQDLQYLVWSCIMYKSPMYRVGNDNITNFNDILMTSECLVLRGNRVFTLRAVCISDFLTDN